MDDNTKNLIQNHIDSNEVCLFMKGTPDAPQCGFSMAVSNMLKILEVNFQGVNVLEDQNLEKVLKSTVTGRLSLSFILIKNLWVVVISLKKCTKVVN
jgi:glutaredoxin-related protein